MSLKNNDLKNILGRIVKMYNNKGMEQKNIQFLG